MSGIRARPIAFLAVCAPAACSSTSTEVLPPPVNVSMGQQLIDLKKARNSGAISPKEHEQQVRRLIDIVQWGPVERSR